MASPEAFVELFCKKAALKTYAEFTGKHLYWGLFLIQLQALETPIQVFSYEFCEIFKNTYFGEHL